MKTKKIKLLETKTNVQSIIYGSFYIMLSQIALIGLIFSLSIKPITTSEIPSAILLYILGIGLLLVGASIVENAGTYKAKREVTIICDKRK